MRGGIMQRYTVGEAARVLGVGTDAVRKRIKRGTIESVLEDGTRYVLLDKSETRHAQGHASGQPSGADGGRDLGSEGLISELRSHNAVLREQLDAERRAHAEARRIIAELVERVPPAIGAPESTADLLEAERRQRMEDVKRERAERLEAQEKAEKLREELEAERSKGFWERLFGTPDE
jgi:excisionase family DNA binding protein